MIERIEVLKDTLQVAVDNGAGRLQRIHELVATYARQHVRELRGEDTIDRQSIYDLVRAINREVGEAATDTFEMLEDAKHALAARRDKE